MGTVLVTTLLAVSLWATTTSVVLPVAARAGDAAAPEAQRPGTGAAPETQPHGTGAAPETQPHGTGAAPETQPHGTGAAPETQRPESGCLDATIDALQARYEDVRDLRARFRQTTRPVYTGGVTPEPLVSSGRMVMAKPAKMRWEYEAPERSLVVSDGEWLWTYDPAFGEAQRLPVGEGMLSGAALQFLLGEGDLRRAFEITLVACEGDSAELELEPREPASYEKLRVVVDRDTGALVRTRVDDLLGNVTLVELSELETNRDPAPATFTFEVPEGVSVIELDPRVPRGVPRP